MKHTLFTFLLLTIGITSLFAQQTIEVVLSEEHPLQTERLDLRGWNNESNVNGNVTVNLNNATNLDASVTITVENTDESNLIIFFSRSWTKKELRKFHIVDKLFNNSNTEIENCQDIRNDIFIKPSEDVDLISLDLERGRETVYRIPFYIAKKKKTFLNLCNRTILQKKCIVELRIMVEEKIDKEIVKLQEELETLCSDYQKAVERHEFCANPSHNPSLEERTYPYLVRKNGLFSRIKDAQGQWPVSCKQYERYQELFSRIETVRLDDDFLVNILKDDCGEHFHKCKYCKYSLDALKKEIEGFYVSTQKGKETKEKVWGDVRKLYICSKQPKRNKEKQAVELKEIIETYYKILNPNNK